MSHDNATTTSFVPIRFAQHFHFHTLNNLNPINKSNQILYLQWERKIWKQS